MRQTTSSLLLALLLASSTEYYSTAFLLESKANSRSLPIRYQTHEQVENFRIKHANGQASKDTIDVVMKFGGSSLADASRVDHVANLIKDQIKEGYRPRAVVCSAMGKTTNALLSAGDFALGESNYSSGCVNCGL